jgi:hypothetical protein
VKLARLTLALFRWLTILAFLLAFVWLDWLPVVKALGGLRREQSDLKRKIKEYNVMAAHFIFPDAEERTLIAGSHAELRWALPQTETDAAWLDMALRALASQTGEGHVTRMLSLASPDPDSAPAEPEAQDGKADDLGSWLGEQRQDILRNFRSAADPGRFPWRFLLADPGNLKGQEAASRPLLVALAAPLSSLLDFINRISRGEARLEIVRLHLEPGAALSRAWLICRGNYLVRKPSLWTVKGVPKNAGGDLLIDPDSPMLWQKVSRGIMSEVPHRELTPTVSKPK